MKILQLNIYHGYFLDVIIAYLARHDFDVIHFQEISRGKLWGDFDTYAKLQETLPMESVFEVCWKFEGEPDSYFGNATFYNSSLKLLKKEVIPLEPYRQLEKLEKNKYENLPRAALALEFAKDNRTFWSINTHMAWGITPLDEPYKIRQGKILADFLETLKAPFVLTGDFNVAPETQTIALFNALSHNLISEHDITNTLNPRKHRVKELFPKGVAVDYIFVGNGVKANDFTVIDSPDMSDHYGLSADIII